jgi:hypothetical protein
MAKPGARRSQTGKAIHPAGAARFHGRFVDNSEHRGHGDGRPEIEYQAGHGTAKFGGRNADDGEFVLVDAQGRSDDLRIGAEAAPPQAIADDDDGGVVRGEGSAV